MKNNTIALFLLVVSLFPACKKKEENNNMRFLVNNVSDVVINQYTDTTIFITPEIKYLSGDQEPVTLTISGLPDGVIAEHISANGYPTYAVRMPLKCYFKTEGSYPITLTAKGIKSGTQTLVFNLIVKAKTCPDYGGLLGEYKSTDCYSTGRVSVHPGSNTSEIIISTGLGEFYVPINCDNRSYTISSRVNSVIKGDLSGTITYTNNTITINWIFKNMVPGFVNETCTQILTK